MHPRCPLRQRRKTAARRRSPRAIPICYKLMASSRPDATPPTTASTRFLRVEEHDARRVADRGVVTGKLQPARFAIDVEHRDVVAPLVAAVKESAARVEVETARIVPAGPFVGDEAEQAGIADGEDADAVMQPIAGVDEPAVGRHEDFRTKVAACKTRRQRRDCLPPLESTGRGVEVEQNDGRRLLLDGVQPAASDLMQAGMKSEMPGSVAGRQSDMPRSVGINRQRAVSRIEPPDVDIVETQIG